MKRAVMQRAAMIPLALVVSCSPTPVEPPDTGPLEDRLRDLSTRLQDALVRVAELEGRLEELAAQRIDASIAVTAIDGTTHRPLDVPPSRVGHVLFFVTHDCPIANQYAPEIQSIREDFHEQRLAFSIVHVDPDAPIEQLKTHTTDYGHTAPVLHDAEHRLVNELGITRTPEVAIVDADGALRYRGRIDDLYPDLGVKRRKARRTDLRDVLEALLAGEKIANPRTRAIGCPVPTLR